MAPSATDPPGEAFERWRAAAAKAAGMPVSASTTPGGITVEPLYQPRRGTDWQPWRAGEAWAVAQRIDHPDPAEANAQALVDLEGGADALTLVCRGSPYARGHGLPMDRAGLAAALEGVELDLIALRLDAVDPTALVALAEIASERRLGSAGLMIDGGCDPIGAAACAGCASTLDWLPTAVEVARRGGFRGCPLLADGRPYHEAGAGEAEELAATLATAIGYLRALAAGGYGLDAARDAIAMLLPVDAELLPGIAKLRALRRLWARVEEACSLDPRPLRLHAEASWRCMTRLDVHTNALRGALGAAAAGLGGADVVTVLPMTLAAGLPDVAARRLARNTGRVLIDEAHLARVDDPAGGTGAIEAITAALCEDAWDLFQQIESRGGLPVAGAWLHRRIAKTASARAAAIASLAPGIVGTSLYPSTDATLSVTPRTSVRRPPPAAALPRRRDAEVFEELRERGEAAGRPQVFLAALGAPSGYGPRAAFAANLLAAGGLAATVPSADGDLGAAFRLSGAAIACLCGSDEAYRKGAAEAIVALRNAGAALILLVGRDEHWRKAGADLLAFDGCPTPQVLAAVLDKAIAPRD